MEALKSDVFHLQNGQEIAVSSVIEDIKPHLFENFDFVPLAINTAVIKFNELIELNKNSTVDPKLHFEKLMIIVSDVISQMFKEMVVDIMTTSESNDENSKEVNLELIHFTRDSLTYHEHNVKFPDSHDEPNPIEFKSVKELDERLFTTIMNVCVEYGIKRKVFSRDGNKIDLTPNFKPLEQLNS